MQRGGREEGRNGRARDINYFFASLQSPKCTRHKGMKSDLADLMAHKEGTVEKEEACIQAASSLPTIMRSAEPKKGVATTSHDVSLAADDRNNKERMLWDEEQVATLRCIFHRN